MSNHRAALGPAASIAFDRPRRTHAPGARRLQVIDLDRSESVNGPIY
jgi:hypothetical protein